MKRAAAGLVAALSAVCRAGTVLAFLTLISVVLLQVIGRVPGIPSPAWTEEVARFALLHLVAFSCGLAVLRGDLVNVDLLIAHLSPAARKTVDRFVDVVVLVFAVALLPGAWAYVEGSVGERARSLDAPMLVVYVTVLIIPAMISVFAALRLLGFGGAPHREEDV